MEIAISRIKVVIEDLQAAELAYKRQIGAFEDIYQAYHSIAQDGYDRHAMKKALENMRETYKRMRRYRIALSDIVDEYESTEYKIMQMSIGAGDGGGDLHRMDTEAVRNILNSYHIKIE